VPSAGARRNLLGGCAPQQSSFVHRRGYTVQSTHSPLAWPRRSPAHPPPRSPLPLLRPARYLEPGRAASDSLVRICGRGCLVRICGSAPSYEQRPRASCLCHLCCSGPPGCFALGQTRSDLVVWVASHVGRGSGASKASGIPPFLAAAQRLRRGGGGGGPGGGKRRFTPGRVRQY
jgi:hypothetical protein